jgi:hypothetical protein
MAGPGFKRMVAYRVSSLISLKFTIGSLMSDRAADSPGSFVHSLVVNTGVAQIGAGENV